MDEVGLAATRKKTLRDRNAWLFHKPPIGFTELARVDPETHEFISLKKPCGLMGNGIRRIEQRLVNSHVVQEFHDAGVRRTCRGGERGAADWGFSDVDPNRMHTEPHPRGNGGHGAS